MFEILITTELMCYGSFIFPQSNHDPCSINTFQSSCQFKVISIENFVRWKQLKFLSKITALLLVFGAELRVALCLLTFNAFNGVLDATGYNVADTTSCCVVSFSRNYFLFVT